MIQRLIVSLLLLLPLETRAQELPYLPPEIGLTVIYDVGITNRVVAAEGDIVTMEASVNGQATRQRLYRGLTAMDIGSIELTVDQAAANSLWPLAEGKSVTIATRGTDSAAGINYTGLQTIRVIGYETLEIGGVLLETVVLDIEGVLTAGTSVVVTRQRSWYSIDYAIDLKSDLTYSMNRKEQQSLSFAAVSVTLP